VEVPVTKEVSLPTHIVAQSDKCQTE